MTQKLIAERKRRDQLATEKSAVPQSLSDPGNRGRRNSFAPSFPFGRFAIGNDDIRQVTLEGERDIPRRSIASCLEARTTCRARMSQLNVDHLLKCTQKLVESTGFRFENAQCCNCGFHGR